MSAPNSTIYIMSDVPLDNRYEHSLWFVDPSAQLSYFRGKVVKTFQKYTFLRKSWDLKVEATMDQAREWVYLMFQNGDLGKVYYYFINNIEYVNDNTVQLFIELDVIQTYQFDWALRQTFVERCHTTSDEIGEHIIEEGLETGPLINAYSEDKTELNDMYIMVLSTVDENSACAFSQMYDGIFSGLKVSAVNTANYPMLGQWLDGLATDGTIDSVVSMWVYPKSLVQLDNDQDNKWLKTVVGCSEETCEIEGLNHFIGNTETPLFEGYVPKNNKLYTYPFNFVYADNNNGGSCVYPYEMFDDGSAMVRMHFQYYGCISPDGTVKLTPLHYKGCQLAHEESLSIGSFPSCAWDSDVYKVWLAQNQNSQAHFVNQQMMDAGFGATSAVANVFTLNAGGVVGGLQSTVNAGMAIEGLMAQRRDMAIQPPQAKGNFSSTVNVANGRQVFTFYRRCITGKFAKAIDDFFTRYGYKVNEIMLPNIHARERFTYIKTVGCLIGGRICTEDRVKIENIFDRGITFWDPNKSIVGIYLGENPTL